MGYRYSLAQVEVFISRTASDLTTVDTARTATGLVASFGGQGSMLGSISLSRKEDRFDAVGDPTGGFVINESLDSTGEVTISVKQFIELANTLTALFIKYDDNHKTLGFGPDSDNQGSVNIMVAYGGNIVATAFGCYLNMSEISLEEEAGDREFTFVAGEVHYEPFGELTKKI